MSDKEDSLPVVGQAKIWSKSKLIEDIRANQQAILEREFNRDDAGELEYFDVVLVRDVEALIKDKMNDALNGSTDKRYIEKKVNELLDEMQ